MTTRLLVAIALMVGALVALVGIDASLTPADAAGDCVVVLNIEDCWPEIGDICDPDPNYIPNPDEVDPQYNWMMCEPGTQATISKADVVAPVDEDTTEVGLTEQRRR